MATRKTKARAGVKRKAPARSIHEVVKELHHLLIPLPKLNVDPGNARKHDQRSLEALAASLKRFGQRAPLVVQRKGMIVRAGNGRLEAMRLLGWTHCAALLVSEKDADAVAFAIADNRTADLSHWNYAQLNALFKGLDAEAPTTLGFTKEEIDSISLNTEWASTELPAPAKKPHDPLDMQRITLHVHKTVAKEIRAELRKVARRHGDKVRLG